MKAVHSTQNRPEPLDIPGSIPYPEIAPHHAPGIGSSCLHVMQISKDTNNASLKELRDSMLKQFVAHFGMPPEDGAYCAYCGTETQSSGCHVCKTTEYLVPKESPLAKVDQFFEGELAPVRQMKNAINESVRSTVIAERKTIKGAAEARNKPLDSTHS